MADLPEYPLRAEVYGRWAVDFMRRAVRYPADWHAVYYAVQHARTAWRKALAAQEEAHS